MRCTSVSASLISVVLYYNSLVGSLLKFHSMPAITCIMLQLPEALLQERDMRAKWHGIPVLLQKLYESSHLNSDLSHTHNVLKVPYRTSP